MAEQTATPEAPAGDPPQQQLDQGTYQVIRNRLTQHGQELRQRLDQLNAARREVFGSIPTELIATERVTTSNNCVPRDMVLVGDALLFGYNVHFGLRTEIHLEDVFSQFTFDGEGFHAADLQIIRSDAFEKDFKDLYRFYKHTSFTKFFRKGPHLYMKFRVGKDVDDFKAFKWAIEGDKLVYVDNRSDHEVRYPDQHEFQWRRATRDMQSQGKFPHYNILDKVFVETTGGDLTIKVEDNTDSGHGIYTEPVDDPDQSLDDAEVSYVNQDPIVLLRVRPYQEQQARHFIFNVKLQEVKRVDALARSCRMLPDDHGLIWSNGYYLESGQLQTFPNVPAELVFERRITSPNGEDYLYVFYDRREGAYALLSYNLIEQSLQTPTVCSGYAFYDDGKLLYFKAHDQPQRHHPIQVWQTPYVGPDFQLPGGQTESKLYKIGNRDIVRGMAQCSALLQLIQRDALYESLYIDIAAAASDLLDGFYWLGDEACFDLAAAVRHIRDTAQAAVGEYERLVRTQQATKQRTEQVGKAVDEAIAENHARLYEHISEFVDALAGLRSLRGQVIALRELKYADAENIDGLEEEIADQTESISQRAVEFLLRDGSLDPYRASVRKQAAQVEKLDKVADAKAHEKQVDATADELEMLIDIVSNLRIEDATQRTTIIDNISAIFAELNAARSALRNRLQELGRSEGIAEFSSQLKLLNQSVVNYLDLCDTPERCDEYLTKVMVQVEELEGRFAEFDEFVEQLAARRDELYNAFENRKLQLVEKRNRRAASLASAADRILSGIRTRLGQMEEIEQINSYFAGDLMIEKVRDIIADLGDLGDSVRVDDIRSKLKTIREDVVRQLKDRHELQADGKGLIRFGRHRFSVNTQPIDLTTVLRDGLMTLHLTGTQFFEPIRDETLLATRDVWDQEVVSEDEDVYRAEYLAWLVFHDLGPLNEARRRELLNPESDALLKHVQQSMSPRYAEGYTKGVHDVDATKMLRELLDLAASIGKLRYPSHARAMAAMFWHTFDNRELKSVLATQFAGFGAVAKTFPGSGKQQLYVRNLARLIEAFAEAQPTFDAKAAPAAAEYLFSELTDTGGFCCSQDAARIVEAFLGHLRTNKAEPRFRQSIEDLHDHPMEQFMLIRDWISAFLDASDLDRQLMDAYIEEAAAKLFEGSFDKARVIPVSVRRTIGGLVGSHAVIQKGQYDLDYNRFFARLDRFAHERVPRFEQYTKLKRQITDAARDEMRLEEFTPRVLSSFVRNKLIDSVFLPLIGDNLAKQMGTADEANRTDRQGLLLLISPPGYGKTTLMEYIASRLGIIFMKINGPALGHGVTSLDPASAPNAAAREELEKLNLALEMGDNVMLYVDDIQHTHSEFLQKFISLCDAQRRIEGVYKNRTRTYDFRGRRVAVVMAGNPYTESGEKFRIPDMLANRADTYNLGDIIGDHREAFEMSYLENCLTSNPALNALATRSQADVYGIVRIARTGSREGVDLEGNYTADEVNEMVAVMKKLMAVRDVILKVNQQYIRSAGMEDQYRTEPAFLLQGSYRNMNRIAEKVVPVMNDQELKTLILSSYEQDAQTLTTGAEANLLKFKDMMGWLTENEAKRWAALKETFARNNRVRSLGGDEQNAAVLSQLADFNQNLGHIRQAILDAQQAQAKHDDNGHAEPARLQIDDAVLDRMQEALAALATARETAAPPAAAPSPEAITGQASPYEIRVVNKVPATLFHVMKDQFELMKGWLEPLTRLTADQDEGIRKLHESVERLSDRYDKLINRLETTADQDEMADG